MTRTGAAAPTVRGMRDPRNARREGDALVASQARRRGDARQSLRAGVSRGTRAATRDYQSRRSASRAWRRAVCDGCTATTEDRVAEGVLVEVAPPPGTTMEGV